jgi:hypothetical protein
MAESLSDLCVRLNAETGKVLWPEIQRLFARGLVQVVSQRADLLEIAVAIASDHRDKVETWMADGDLSKASTEDARSWQEADPVFWAVVAAPWVLVQEIKEGP